ncbi:MAG: sugar nucleotide-binding protein, partial [bacterium]|nr:sugar nucleotide-binding protein [bacterium]
MIGQHFVRWCEERNIPYIGTRNSRETEGLIPFNLLDFDRIPRLLDEISPSVLIDAVGLAGGVNFCEENPGVGRKYHVDATKIMVDWCKARDVPFAFISTDYVFDGRRPPYKENDPTNPLNLYGQLKLEAEQLIQEHLKKYVIARTTNVFGWDPETVTPNFHMHLIDTLKEKDSIKVPSFLYGNPTYVGDLAEGIMDLI